MSLMKKSAKVLASVTVAAAAVVLTSCAGGQTGGWGSCGVKEAPASCKGISSCKGQNGCKGASCKQDSCK